MGLGSQEMNEQPPFTNEERAKYFLNNTLGSSTPLKENDTLVFTVSENKKQILLGNLDDFFKYKV